MGDTYFHNLKLYKMYIIHSKPKGHTYMNREGIIVPSPTASRGKKRFTLVAEYTNTPQGVVGKYGLSVFRNTTENVLINPRVIHLDYIPAKWMKKGITTDEIVVCKEKKVPIETFSRKEGLQKAIKKLSKFPHTVEYKSGIDPKVAFLQEFDIINHNPVEYYQAHFKRKGRKKDKKLPY